MAKGAESKQIITQKILDTFDGAFVWNDGKEIRIPIVENGEPIEIKIALTCAKENVGGGSPVAPQVSSGRIDFSDAPPQNVTAPTDEELETVRNFMNALGI